MNAFTELAIGVNFFRFIPICPPPHLSLAGSLALPRLSVSDIRARGGSAHGYRVDITDDALVDAAARLVETEVGAVDVLVNNAGFVRRVSVVHSLGCLH